MIEVTKEVVKVEQASADETPPLMFKVRETVVSHKNKISFIVAGIKVHISANKNYKILYFDDKGNGYDEDDLFRPYFVNVERTVTSKVSDNLSIIDIIKSYGVPKFHEGQTVYAPGEYSSVKCKVLGIKYNKDNRVYEYFVEKTFYKEWIVESQLQDRYSERDDRL